MSLTQKIKSRNDKEVVAQLYKEIMPAVKKYIRSNGGSNDDAHDVFQESLLSVYKRVFNSNEVASENLNGYLYKACVYNWINRAKYQSKFTSIEDIRQDKVVTNESVFFDVGTDERKSSISSLFQRLGEKCKTVLELSIYSELSQEDIMERMQLTSIGSVKMQYKRCKMKLMELLKNEPLLLKKLKNAHV